MNGIIQQNVVYKTNKGNGERANLFREQVSI